MARAKAKRSDTSTTSTFSDYENRRNVQKKASQRASHTSMPSHDVSKQTPTNTVWQNIVIHYLSKLINYWRASTSNADGVKLVARKTSSVLSDDTALVERLKAMDIVASALKYGVENDIVHSDGKCYWIKKPKNMKSPKRSLKSNTTKASSKRTLARLDSDTKRLYRRFKKTKRYF